LLEHFCCTGLRLPFLLGALFMFQNTLRRFPPWDAFRENGPLLWRRYASQGEPFGGFTSEAGPVMECGAPLDPCAARLETFFRGGKVGI